LDAVSGIYRGNLMMHGKTIALLTLSALIIGACSEKAPSTAATPVLAPIEQPAVGAAPVPVIALNMSGYKDMQVVDLIKDSTFGKQIVAIVPKAQIECVKSSFVSMPALTLDSANNASSEASGSHAENWITAYVQASPDRQLDVAVVCGEAAAGQDDHYLYFTSRGIDAALPAGLKTWLNDVSAGKGTVTVFDGKRQKDVSASVLVADLQQNVAGELKSSATEATISDNSFTTVGGVLKVGESADGSQGITLNGRVVSGISDDSIELIKAYSYGTHDVVLLSHQCSGSSCGYKSLMLVDVNAAGSATVIGGDKMTVSNDAQIPDVKIDSDGSLKIAFTGDKGKERWSYANGILAKEG
jgi:hypothetical protein